MNSKWREHSLIEFHKYYVKYSEYVITLLLKLALPGYSSSTGLFLYGSIENFSRLNVTKILVVNLPRTVYKAVNVGICT
jgi:hypothetical protein